MKKTILLFPIMLMLAMPVLAIGATQPPSGGNPTNPGGGNPTSAPVNVSVKITNPFSVGNNLFEVLKAIVNNVILPIGGSLCVLAFIYAGFKYVIAQGSPTKIAEAHRILLYAAIGTAVILGSWMITQVISNTIGSVLSGSGVNR